MTSNAIWAAGEQKYAIERALSLSQYFLNTSMGPAAENAVQLAFMDGLSVINDRMTRFITEGVQAQSPEVLDFLVQNANDPYWGKVLAGNRFSRQDVSDLLNKIAYQQDYQRTNPKLFEEVISPNAQSILTGEHSKTKKTQAILALYGHDYFLKKAPMILRIMAPFEKGDSNRGKKPNLPQVDLALFVYNGEELIGGVTTEALVYYQNEFTQMDVSETRAKIIRKESLVRECLSFGLYESREIFLPVLAVPQGWQNVFVSVIDEFVRRESGPRGVFNGNGELIDKVKNCARAFPGRRSLNRFYRDTVRHRYTRYIFESEAFKTYLQEILGDPSHKACKVLTQMTTIEEIKI